MIHVMLIGTLPAAFGSHTCDPAIDLDAPGIAAALTRYERERTDDARKAIPLKAGSAPVLFAVEPASAAAWRWITQGAHGTEQAQRAVAVCCHGYADERGVEHSASAHGKVEQIRSGLSLASDDWIDHLHDAFGAAAIEEIGAVVMDRAKAGPRALSPFRLPRGLILPR